MWSDFPLFPPQASTMAPRVDLLYFFLVGVAVFFSALIFILIVAFAIKFQRRAPDQKARAVPLSWGLEALWIAVPLAITLVIFGWGAALFSDQWNPPPDPMEIYVVGRQWMWKFQHQSGISEINELHVPLNKPVRLTMASEDVIHSLFVPGFRVKMDVLPGRYTHLWFEATKEGAHTLFCAEFCGTKHSAMLGKVIALKPAEFEKWLESSPAGLAAGGASAQGAPLKAEGAALFQRLGCSTCHVPESNARAPILSGLLGSRVRLADGRTVTADESYVRESILNPGAKIVAGYAPLMPAFKGQATEEDLLQLVEYIRSLEKNAP